MSDGPPVGAGADSGWRVWAARGALALAVPVLFLLALEGGLRVAGYGKPATFLIPDDRPGWYRTNPDFAGLFLPGNFDLRPLNLRLARHKPANTVRIVVLGESAAQGVPVPSFGFAPQLRAQLRQRYPGREFEVIDTGIVAVNSHVVYQVARELAGFEPDLFIVYAGNNEVVGPYGPGCAYLSRMPPLWVIRASVFVRSTRTGQWLASLIGRISSSGGRAAEWGGMSMFVDNAVAADDPRLDAVYGAFAENLRGIVRAASGAGAKTLLCTVVANLRDCPPFLSRHGSRFEASDLAAWRSAHERGRLAWILGDSAEARAQLDKALRIDPEFADTSFMMGTLDLQSGDIAPARRHFVDALHFDALRFRPDPQINRVIRGVAAEGLAGASLLDAAVEMGSDPASKGPICGRDLLFEHVHLDWRGNFELARMMARSSAAALSGRDPGESGWLESAACAGALGYTPHERLPMLLGIDVLVRKPPFTNQLTYVDDQARMAREIEVATRDRTAPGTLLDAARTAEDALAEDPGNPALAGILEGIDLDKGDTGGALAMARRVAELVPSDFALAADQASILMRMGRLDEAGRILTGASSSGADLDLLCPVLRDFWIRSARLGEGVAFLGKALSLRPRDTRLRIVRGELFRASGDTAAAEREFRGVLAMDPSSEDALEALVGILNDAGKGEDAARQSADSAPSQPRNQQNHLRAAKYFESRGDRDGLVGCLLAAERSGPVNATFELTLALKLYQLKRMDAMMEHLGEARRLSAFEGNPEVTDSITGLIARMRAEWERAQEPQ